MAASIQNAPYRSQTDGDRREKFFIWLASKVSATQLSELYDNHHRIDQFCLPRKLLANPLFQIDDVRTVQKLVKELKKSLSFRIQKNSGLLFAILDNYVQYLRESEAEKKNSLDPLVQALRSDGFETIDRRGINGCLWVIAGEDKAAYFVDWNRRSIFFSFEPNGSTATGNRPAWWTRARVSTLPQIQHIEEEVIQEKETPQPALLSVPVNQEEQQEKEAAQEQLVEPTLEKVSESTEQSEQSEVAQEEKETVQETSEEPEPESESVSTEQSEQSEVAQEEKETAQELPEEPTLEKESKSTGQSEQSKIYQEAFIQDAEESLLQSIASRGFEYIDNRWKDGCLWVICGREQSSFFHIWQKKGVHFYFSPGGRKATKYRPAWWTKDVMENENLHHTAEEEKSLDQPQTEEADLPDNVPKENIETEQLPKEAHDQQALSPVSIDIEEKTDISSDQTVDVENVKQEGFPSAQQEPDNVRPESDAIVPDHSASLRAKEETTVNACSPEASPSLVESVQKPVQPDPKKDVLQEKISPELWDFLSDAKYDPLRDVLEKQKIWTMDQFVRQDLWILLNAYHLYPMERRKEIYQDINDRLKTERRHEAESAKAQEIVPDLPISELGNDSEAVSQAQDSPTPEIPLPKPEQKELVSSSVQEKDIRWAETIVYSAKREGISIQELSRGLLRSVEETERIVQAAPHLIPLPNRLVHEDALTGWEDAKIQLKSIWKDLLTKNKGKVSPVLLYLHMFSSMSAFLQENDINSKEAVYAIVQHYWPVMEIVPENIHRESENAVPESSAPAQEEAVLKEETQETVQKEEYILTVAGKEYMGSTPALVFAQLCVALSRDYLDEFGKAWDLPYNGAGKVVISSKMKPGYMWSNSLRAYIDREITENEAAAYSQWISRLCGAPWRPVILKMKPQVSKRVKPSSMPPGQPASLIIQEIPLPEKNIPKEEIPEKSADESQTIDNTSPDKTPSASSKWEIVDDTTAIHTCNASFVKYNGTDIPRHMYRFFDMEKMLPLGRKGIMIVFQNQKNNAIIIKDYDTENRDQIFWRPALGEKLKAYTDGRPVQAVFKKIGKDEYELSVTVSDSIPMPITEEEQKNPQAVLPEISEDQFDQPSGKYFSWEIIDANTAVKTCDKTFFERNESGVPKGILSFFDAQSLQPREIKRINLVYQSETFVGKLEREAYGGRVRIYWDNDTLFARSLNEYEDIPSVKAVFYKHPIKDEYEVKLVTETSNATAPSVSGIGVQSHEPEGIEKKPTEKATNSSTSRIKWDQYETAKLIETYWKIQKDPGSREEELSRLSRLLRQYGIDRGIEIDDIYRNYNGMCRQYLCIEGIFTDGTRGYSSASAMFIEIADLYLHNRPKFDSILLEANKLMPDHSDEAPTEKTRAKSANPDPLEKKNHNDTIDVVFKQEQLFLKWMEGKATQEVILDLYKASSPLNAYCQSRKLYRTSLFLIKDQALLSRVLKKLENDKYFQSLNRAQIMMSLLRYYISYLFEQKDDNSRFIPKTSGTRTEEKKLILTSAEQIDQQKNETVVSPTQSKPETRASSASKTEWEKQMRDAFYDWLKKKEDSMSKAMGSFICMRTLNKLAQQNPTYRNSLYSIQTLEEFQVAQSILGRDQAFMKEVQKCRRDGYDVYTKFLVFLPVYLRSLSTPKPVLQENPIIAFPEKRRTVSSPPLASIPASPNKPVDVPDTDQYINILRRFFPKGFQKESGLDMKRFRTRWEETCEKPIEQTDETIRGMIARRCVDTGSRWYLAETLLTENDRKQLLSYIDGMFASGKKALYYLAVYRALEKDLESQNLTADLLTKYLQATCKGRYYYYADYLAAAPNTRVDIAHEIAAVMKEYGRPLHTDTLAEQLPHIPLERLDQEVHFNSVFLCNGPHVYFHESMADIAQGELEQIASMIQDTLDDQGFMLAHEMLTQVRKQMPELSERLSDFSDMGQRSIFTARLRKQFTFTGKVITPLGQAMNLVDMFSMFCKRHAPFTLDELSAFAEESNAPIYWDTVHANCARVSEDQFVPMAAVHVNKNLVDAAIDQFCKGDYVLLGEINIFNAFPYAGYPWNAYLLEQYAATMSPGFTLMHGAYTKTGTPGVIVRRNAKYTNYDEILSDALAESSLVLQTGPCLDWLAEQGYIARKKLNNIAELIAKAKLLRSQKG